MQEGPGLSHSIVLALVSPRPGVGKTTLALHLAAGFFQLGNKVLLLDAAENFALCHWLQVFPQPLAREIVEMTPSAVKSLVPYIVKGRLDDLELDVLPINREIILQQKWADLYYQLCQVHPAYDLIILDVDHDPLCIEFAAKMAHYFIAPVNLSPEGETDELIALNQRIKDLSGQEKELHVLVPIHIDTREWEQNSRQLFQLVEVFGERKMTDIIGKCSRIYDLPLVHKTAWQLGQDHIEEAFNRILLQIRQILL